MAGFDRFNKVWSDAGVKLPPSDAQASAGFAYLGPTPPSVELFNGINSDYDEKDNWLFNQIASVIGVPPTETPNTQLRDAINTLIAGSTPDTSGFALKAGDVITGSFAFNTPGRGVNFVQPTTLVHGVWNTNSLGFGWDGANLRMRVDDTDVGIVTLNTDARYDGRYVNVTGDNMTGTLNGTTVAVTTLLYSGGDIQALGMINAGTNVNAAGTISAGANVNAAGDVYALNMSATQDIYAARAITSGGDITATVNVWAYSVIAAALVQGAVVNAYSPSATWGTSGVYWGANSVNNWYITTDAAGAMTLNANNVGVLKPYIMHISFDGTYFAMNYGTGAFNVAGGPWIAMSDARMKQNIVDYTKGLEAIKQLTPREYSFIPETGVDSSLRFIGMVSQEIQPIMPETVNIRGIGQGEGLTQMGSFELPDALSFNPNAITYALVNAVKELAARVEQLEGA